MNSFPLSNNKYLFFDIFYRDGKIFMIMPIYERVITPNEITVKIKDTRIQISEQHVKDSYEPTCIYIYDIREHEGDTAEIFVQYGELTNSYTLQNINEDKKELTLTTLFKDDYKNFPLFHNYYTKQGVSHFYMYYNGKITESVSKIMNLPNVTLIEWDFLYWNQEPYKYKHHAQMGQISDALYKYNSEYMIFCDLDEYMYIQTTTLLHHIRKYNNVDVFGFHTIWANTLDNQYPIDFPSTIMVGDMLPYNLRSKNIYKTSSVDMVGIHNCRNFKKENIKFMHNLPMFHFYNWSEKNRVEKCNKIIKIQL